MNKYIFFLFVGITSIISAQNSISGTITDAKTKETLFGVNVYAPDIQKGTATDEDGIYQLKKLPDGNVKIVIAYVGYNTITKIINLKNSNIKLNIALKPSVFEMDAVIVSTPFDKLQSENVVKVDQRDIKALQRDGGSTLIQGLATIPGVEQITTGTSIGKPVIRGLSSNRVLVYAQGVRLENQQFGGDHGLGVNEAGIGSVEVIKGPASLLYGSDALGGVLYLNPEKFADVNSTVGGFSEKLFSNTLGSNTSAVVKSSGNSWKYIIRGTLDSHIDYKIPGDKRVTNSRYKEYDLKTGIGYSKNKFSSTLRYNYNKLFLGIPEAITQQTTTRIPTFPQQKVYNHILSLHNKYFFQNSKIDANIGYIYNDRNEYENSSTPNLRMILKTLDYDVKYHLPKMGKFESIVGIQGMHQTNSNKATEFLIPNATTDDIGIFGTINYEWNKNALQGGLRFDNRHVQGDAHLPIQDIHHIASLDKKFSSFNSSLGFKTTVFSNLILRLNVATGFRAPNLAELTSNGVHEGTNRYEHGNPNLKTEQNVQTDFDLSYKREHIEFYANGFYNGINNYIFISPTNAFIDNNRVYNYSQNNAHLYGGEIGFHIHPHPLDWLHIESDFETVIGKENNGGYLPLIPANKWSNTLRGEFKFNNWLQNGYATIRLESTFKQNHPSKFETASSGYNLVNLGFGGDFQLHRTKFNMTLNINNLFNKSYIPHLSLLKDLGIPSTGRNIVVGIKFNI